jgi:hypothetical protein
MTSRRSRQPLRPEDAVAVLAAAALDIDAVATRTVGRWERLEGADADPVLRSATRRAAESLAEVAAQLRREGLLGHARSG